MIKILKRVSDNKYLKSVESDLWVDNISEAFEMTYRECEEAKNSLSNTYGQGDLREIVNVAKLKPMSREEIKELRNLLKK
jgi:hypothetical protein